MLKGWLADRVHFLGQGCLAQAKKWQSRSALCRDVHLWLTTPKRWKDIRRARRAIGGPL